MNLKTLKINHPNWSIIENIMNKSSVNLENIVIEILEREMWGRKKQLDRHVDFSSVLNSVLSENLVSIDSSSQSFGGENAPFHKGSFLKVITSFMLKAVGWPSAERGPQAEGPLTSAMMFLSTRMQLPLPTLKRMFSGIKVCSEQDGGWQSLPSAPAPTVSQVSPTFFFQSLGHWVQRWLLLLWQSCWL